MTGTAAAVPRPEYPRPQMVRPDWLCLNGEWEFEVDAADSGEERGLRERPLSGRINVPFAPEAPLSGVGTEDFLPAVWYRRRLRFPADWGERAVLLHFQAVDYETTVWANGKEVGRHFGGSTPVTCSLSGVAGPGDAVTVVVRARDDPDRAQPRGKQANRVQPYGSRCARTTGIWQTAWAEPVPATWLRRPRITPNLAAGAFLVEQGLTGPRRGTYLDISLSDAEGVVVRLGTPSDRDLTPQVVLSVPPGRRHLWSPEEPHLYQLSICLRDAQGSEIDRVESYAGLRSVVVSDGAVLLNGRPRFQRLVLDQGYWPAGGMTAPDDAALADDILLAKAAGFDGARAHQRVAEERWLYHADRLGYLIWGEFPDWGDTRGEAPRHHAGFPIEYAGEWLEVLRRDYSHPCIVAWCPLNETELSAGGQITDLDGPTKTLYAAARAADATRPVLDVSGYHHRVAEAEIWDCHDYEQDPGIFSSHYAMLPQLVPAVAAPAEGDPWPGPSEGQAIFVSEFGGACLADQEEEKGPGGYGDPLPTADALFERFSALCGVLLGNRWVAGYCYTQLADTYQERNGLFDSNRVPKVDVDRLAAAQRGPAAIEERARPLGDAEPVQQPAGSEACRDVFYRV